MFRRPDVGLDLGNSKFSICVKGEGIVASEPSYLAFRGEHLTDSSLIAIGDEAKRMYERSHPGITVTTPMSEGVVIDCRAASIFLKRLAKKAGMRSGLSKPKVVVGALYGASDIERKAFTKVAESLDCNKIYVVHEPLAAAIGTHLDINDPYANMILDIGDGATEALIMSQKKTILGSSMRFGGSYIDGLIVEHIRKVHELKISVSQARKIKENVSFIYSNNFEELTIPVKGISSNGLMPCERQIPVASILEVFRKFADKVGVFTLNLISRVTPEVSVDLIGNGIYLCGGASQSVLIKDRLEEVTNLKITIADEPNHAVISGIYRMLDFTKYFGENDQ